MSLDVNLSKIKNYNSVCFVGDKTSPVTQVLIQASVILGYGEITKENCELVFTRFTIYESAFGCFLHQVAGNAHRAERPIALADIKSHIGLTTNVVNLSDVAFWKRVRSRMMRDANDRLIYQKAKEGAAT
jgi:hypothetical protein